MNAETNNLDPILSSIGLKSSMVLLPNMFSVYDERKFTRYVTSEYKNSERRDSDEIYRMFEFNLLHIKSGLRLNLTSSESYDGETVTYTVVELFIITSDNKKLEVNDVDFQKQLFYAEGLEIPF